MSKTHFAPVAPIWLLEQMAEASPDCIGHYHLLLAHDVLAQQSRFANWADVLRSGFAGLNQKVTIIMDSSVIELGHPLSIHDCIKAGEVVKAEVVVLPDIIGDHQGTMNYVHELEAIVHDSAQKSEFMFVPQGRTVLEYVASLEAIADKDWIQWIGLPRDALQFMDSRGTLISACKLICPNKKIHMLGFSNNILDDFWCCRSQSVFGIDSAVPVRAGLRGVPFRLSVNEYGKRETYWDTRVVLNDLAKENIMQTRIWLS